MRFAGFPEELLTFYEGLSADNSKAYWSEHRAVYEESVRAPMEALLAELEPEFGAAHVFRPYRDVRFARDKSPYKTAIGAWTERGGYVQASADGLFVAGGYYETAPDQVERLRASVADEHRGPALERIVDLLRASGYEIGGEQLKTRPRGYPADHPRLALLRHRTLVASRSWTPQEWLHSRAALERVAAGWRGLQPLREWLDTHVGPSRQPARGR